jgi:hypothetical protein
LTGAQTGRGHTPYPDGLIFPQQHFIGFNIMSMFVKDTNKLVKVDMFGISVITITSYKEFKYFVKHNDVLLKDLDGNISYDDFVDSWHKANGASIRYIVGKTGEAYFMIFLRDINHVTACHESVHMSAQILEHKGVPITTDNDEVRAYLTAYLFQELCKRAGLAIVT